MRIRFPSRILHAVTEEARKSGRSRNSEIVYRLAQSLGLAKSEDVRQAGG